MNFEFSGLGPKNDPPNTGLFAEKTAIYGGLEIAIHQKFQRMDSSYALKTMAGPGS